MNTVGFVFVPDRFAVKPKLTDDPAATFAFQPTFFAVTVEPDCAASAFQAWVSFCPSVKGQLSDQPFHVPVPVLVSWTSAWKPSDHWLVTLYVTLQAPVGVGSGPGPGSVVPPSELSP
ncbi:hypothetical protein SPURM210S_04048 [Streptomyces purpurascens]